MDQKELPVDYKFITRMGLDKRLFDSFTELRKLLKKHGYTDDTVHVSSSSIRTVGTIFGLSK